MLAVALLAAGCGGGEDAERAQATRRTLADGSPITSATTGRATLSTNKIAAPPTTAPAQVPRSSGAGGEGSASSGEDAVGDFATSSTEAPPTTEAPAVGGGGGSTGGDSTGGGSTGGGSTGGGGAATTSSTSTTLPGTVVLKVRQSGYGPILVDGEDHTLYVYAADTDNVGSCVDACAEQWIPIEGTTVLTGSGVEPLLLSSITRADGIVQLTYNSRPLYRLKNEPLGQVLGQNDGQVWFVAASNGVMVVSPKL